MRILSRPNTFRQHMKTGKRRLHEGNLKGAERAFWWAMEIASDYDSPYRKDIGLVEHRLAVVSAKCGDVDRARWRFKKAASRIENNPIGLAICLRDHAGFELLQGKTSAARSLLNRAIKELEKAKNSVETNRKKRLEVEISATRAFVARIDLKEGKNTAKAVDQLKRTAKLLRQYRKKPAYELANLGWLIDALPPEERSDYIERARELSMSLGNTYKWGDYTALRYGEPARGAYRAVTTVASFGFNRLKDIKRHLDSL